LCFFAYIFVAIALNSRKTAVFQEDDIFQLASCLMRYSLQARLTPNRAQRAQLIKKETSFA
jgi:hypothetical protein